MTVTVQICSEQGVAVFEDTKGQLLGYMKEDDASGTKNSPRLRAKKNREKGMFIKDILQSYVLLIDDATKFIIAASFWGQYSTDHSYLIWQVFYARWDWY